MLEDLENEEEDLSQNDLLIEDNEQEQKVEEIKRFLEDMDKDQLLKQYKQEGITLLLYFQYQGLSISSLSLPKYKTLFQNCPKQLIPIVPELPKLNSPSDKNFLSFRQLSEVSLSVANTLQESLYQTKQKWTLYHKNLFLNKANQVTTLPTLSRQKNLSIGSSDFSKYNSFQMSRSIETDINYQLMHNKDALQLLSSKSKQKQIKSIDENITDLKDKGFLYKQSKYKVYPSKIIEEQKRQALQKLRASLGDSFQQDEQTTNKDQKQDQQAPLKTKIYDVYWYQEDQYFMKPQVRENASFCQYKNQIILWGGQGMRVFKSFWFLDTQTLNWKYLEQQGNNCSIPRHSHTTQVYKKSLVIFGGEIKKQNEIGKREYLVDVKLYNIETNTWLSVTPQSYQISARRNHISCVVGKFMIVHGGIDYRQHHTNDTWIFDLQSYKWAQAEIEKLNNDIHPKGVAFHQGCGVYHPLKKYQFMYRNEEIKQSDRLEKKSPYQNEGLYVFGGLSSEDLVDNQLYLLKTDIRPMKWIVVQAKGQPPSRRYGHTMTYNDRLGVLVVFGGRDDVLFFHDVYIFRLDNQSWQNVNVMNSPNVGRAFHGAAHIDTKMYVFGGYGEKGFVSSDVHILELDTQIAKQLSRRIQINENYEEKPKKKKQEQGEKKNSNTDWKQQQIDSQQKQKEMIEKLNFKNLKSFVPMPMIPSYKIVPQTTRKANPTPRWDDTDIFAE